MAEKYFYDDQGRLNILVRAIPFGGPVYLDEKDFQGHYFHPGTDIGPLKEALSYLNHNKLTTEHPELKSLPGINDRLGTAIREDDLSDEEGIVYRIIVDEGYRYKNLLKILSEKDLLMASTTPFQRSIQIDKSTGRVDRWEVVEVAPTWKPANPDAEQLFKSILEEELIKMENKTNETPNAEETSTQTLTEIVDQALAKVDGEEKSVGTTLIELANIVAEQSKNIQSMNEMIQAMREEIRTRDEAQEKSISDIQTAFPKLVELASRSFAQIIADNGKLSNAEKSVKTELVTAPKTNPNAPGRDRKANFGGRG